MSKVKKLSQLRAGLREKTRKYTHTHTDKKDMKRTHMNWSDNSKHSIGRKKLQIVVSLGDDPNFFPLDPDFLLVRSRFFISIEWQVCVLSYAHCNFFFTFRFFCTFQITAAIDRTIIPSI